MRMLIKASMPHRTFNAAVKDGTAGEKIQRILEAIQPEAVYFTEMGGQRTGIYIVNIDDPSQIPSLAEPFFLTFEADVEFHPVMSPDDLGRAGLDELGEKWA